MQAISCRGSAPLQPFKNVRPLNEGLKVQEMSTLNESEIKNKQHYK